MAKEQAIEVDWGAARREAWQTDTQACESATDRASPPTETDLAVTLDALGHPVRGILGQAQPRQGGGLRPVNLGGRHQLQCLVWPLLVVKAPPALERADLRAQVGRDGHFLTEHG